MLKNRTLIALAVFAIVAGAAVWKWTRPDAHAPVSASALPIIAKADVDEVEIIEPQKPPVLLKKEATEWRLVQPVADRADQKAAEQAVDALVALKLRDVVAESAESYAKVGVKDDEVVKLTAKKGGTILTTLLIGKGQNLRIEGSPKVWSTINLKRAALVREPRMWRDRLILDAPKDQIDHLEIGYPTGTIIARPEPAAPPASDANAPPPGAAGAKWMVTQGANLIGGSLDESVLPSLVAALTHIEAEDIVADDVKSDVTGVDQPRTTVRVVLKDGTQKQLFIGKNEGESTYVRFKEGPRIWKIHKYEADRIPPSAAQWRDKLVVKIEPSEITKIELVHDKERVVLERSDTGFKATTPSNVGEIDQGRITSMLSGLTSMRATRIVEESDAKTNGLANPAGVVTVWKKDGSQVRLTFAPEKDNENLLEISTAKTVYAVPSFLAKSFIKSAKDFQKTAAPSQGG